MGLIKKILGCVFLLFLSTTIAWAGCGIEKGSVRILVQ